MLIVEDSCITLFQISKETSKARVSIPFPKVRLKSRMSIHSLIRAKGAWISGNARREGWWTPNFASKECKAHNYPNPYSSNGPPSKSYFGGQSKQKI
jgi:hypothetical protein